MNVTTTPPADQLRILLDGVEQALPADEFERKVTQAAKGERPPLRVKLGVDPTSPDLHLGHAVILRKLRQFQQLGHVVVLIIGGFTAQVGDPSGRSATRPRLSREEVARNAATYLDQARLILGSERLEVVNNADWLEPMTMADVLRLTAQMTVARMLERADFAVRHRSGKPIALSEFLYPLLQGQDSVAVRSDVELGGTDQTFNLLVGRDLQQAAGLQPQCVVTLPLLEGLDGTAKMSKSYGNAVGLAEPPAEIFGKIMSIPDELMPKYFRLATDLEPAEVDAVISGLASGVLHPGATKRRLAREIVALFHSPEAAHAAEQRFDTQFVTRGIPEGIDEFDLGEASEWFLPSLLVAAGLCPSTSDARRHVRARAVRIDGAIQTDETAMLRSADVEGRVLQVGKRRFRRLVRRS